MELLFTWSKDFETNLKNVDDQHYYLVTMVNTIASKIDDESYTSTDINNAFNELLQYTQYHFQEEETIMKEYKVNQEFFEDHAKNHKNFVKNVLQMYEDARNNGYKAHIRNLLDFLISWLAFHILGQDQQMARQIELIKSGYTPDQAYKEIIENSKNQTTPLVKALNTLIEIVVKRNSEIIELKKDLESRVKERTKELIETNKTLQTLAHTDPLTGLANRRHLFLILEMLLANAKDNQSNISCYMIDLDNFKDINDFYGHDMGDKVLIEFSRLISSLIRKDDLFVRLGGDEFFVLLPDTDEVSAYAMAERIINNVRKLEVVVGCSHEIWKGSASIGVATLKPNQIKDANDFMKKADLAVYAAKNSGKNCIRVYQENNYKE